jgi:hypothetical protein
MFLDVWIFEIDTTSDLDFQNRLHRFQISKWLIKIVDVPWCQNLSPDASPLFIIQESTAPSQNYSLLALLAELVGLGSKVVK